MGVAQQGSDHLHAESTSGRDSRCDFGAVPPPGGMRTTTAHTCLLLAAFTGAGCLPLSTEDPGDAEFDQTNAAISGNADAVRVHAILTANDDGSQAATATPAQITAAIDQVRAVFGDADLVVNFDPESDITRIDRTLLNHDCSPAEEPIDVEKYPADGPSAPGDCTPNQAERTRVAQGFPGKVVLFFSSGDRYRYDPTQARWVYGPRAYNYSSHQSEFVALLSSSPDGNVVAHEIGHYLHLVHPFHKQPADLPAAAGMIRDAVAAGLPISEGANTFDADGLPDTPPDPGPGLFVASGLDPCDARQGTITIPVSFWAGISATYQISPDRENVMNYWDKTCRGLRAHITGQQSARVRAAVEHGNRNHLIAPKVLYSAVFGSGQRNQTRAIGWSFTDFSVRMNQEFAAGRRVVHVQAYDLGNNQVRWDGVWEPGGSGQSVVLGWTMADVAAHHEAQLTAGNHLVHLQAYDLGGGQLRWDGIWEPGANDQTWVIGYTLEDLATVFNQQVAEGRHVVHLQAYLVQGEPRYDAVWEPGDKGTAWVGGWTMSDLATAFSQHLSAGDHLVHLQAYDLGGGKLRWDAVWERGARMQSFVIGWTFQDLVGRADAERAAGRQLLHLQAYDAGGGQVRYDAVWEPGRRRSTQGRILSESIGPFAARIDRELTGGQHIVMMQAHTGR